MIWIFLKMLSRVSLWNILPNSHHATFYNFWGGHFVGLAAFRRRFRQDLEKLFELLSRGAINPPVAARFPLLEASAAMELAESRTVLGKVVLVP
jgi:NADPH2:quinone reductase